MSILILVVLAVGRRFNRARRAFVVWRRVERSHAVAYQHALCQLASAALVASLRRTAPPSSVATLRAGVRAARQSYRRERWRTLRAFVAAAVVVLALAVPNGPAMAERGDERPPGGVVYIAGGGGYSHATSGGSVAPWAFQYQRERSSGYAELRAGYRLAPELELELAGVWVWRSLRPGSNAPASWSTAPGSAVVITANARYSPASFFRGRLEPYALAGAGGAVGKLGGLRTNGAAVRAGAGLVWNVRPFLFIDAGAGYVHAFGSAGELSGVNLGAAVGVRFY
jgi:hypothetical protein